MEKQKGMLERVLLPTRIVVHRLELTTEALAEAIRSGELVPASEGSCELESGGQVLARGRIVRRRGEYYFKVLGTGEEEA